MVTNIYNTQTKDATLGGAGTWRDFWHAGNGGLGFTTATFLPLCLGTATLAATTSVAGLLHSGTDRAGVLGTVSASANLGLFNIGPAATAFDGATSGKFVGSANGTQLAINAVSGYTGNIIDAQVAAARKFIVDKDGKVGSATGSTALAAGFHAISTSEQLRLGFDASNYTSLTTGATGVLTLSGSLGAFAFTSSVTSGTGLSSALSLTANSLTTGIGVNVSSSSVTTGKLANIATSGNTWTGNSTTSALWNLASTSTAGTASDSSILAQITRSGTNSNSSHTAYGLDISVTNTGTTSTNIAARLTASGATTNYALQCVGQIQVTTAQGANTSADGLVLTNATPAPSSGNQEYSGRIRWTGQGWKTNSTAGSQTCDFIAELQPVQGSTNPTANLVFSSQINAGGYTARATLTSGGLLTVASFGVDGTANISNVNGYLQITNLNGGNGLAFTANGAALNTGGYMQLTSVKCRFNSATHLQWANHPTDINSAADTGLKRSAAAQVAFTDASTTTYLVLGADGSGGFGLIKCPDAASGAGNKLYIRASAAGSGNSAGGDIQCFLGARANAGTDGAFQVNGTDLSGQIAVLRVATTAADNRQAVYLRGDSGSDKGLFAVGSGASDWSGANSLNLINPDGNIGFWVVGTQEVMRLASSTVLLGEGINIQVGTSTGTQIGVSTGSKLGFWGATAVAQYNTAGTTAGFAANASANAAFAESGYTGGTGSTEYTVGDIVLCLKERGFMAA